MGLSRCPRHPGDLPGVRGPRSHRGRYFVSTSTLARTEPSTRHLRVGGGREGPTRPWWGGDRTRDSPTRVDYPYGRIVFPSLPFRVGFGVWTITTLKSGATSKNDTRPFPEDKSEVPAYPSDGDLFGAGVRRRLPTSLPTRTGRPGLSRTRLWSFLGSRVH